MRKKFIILPIILSLFSLLSADAPDTLWTRTYNHQAYDYGRSVQQTTDGGFIIAGEAGSNGMDVYLIRTNENGDTIWTKTFGGLNLDRGHSVQQTNDGGFIITGNIVPFADSTDVYLIRTDTSGNTVWEKTFGGDEWDYGHSVLQTISGGFIIAGGTNSFGASYNVYLIYTDANGDTVWTKTFSDGYCAYSIQQIDNGDFIIAGRTGGDVYLKRIDSNADSIWTRTYGGSNMDIGTEVKQTNDGGFIIVGYTWSFGSGAADFYLIRTNSNGDTLWTRTFGDNKDDHGHSVDQTSDNGFIITGDTESFGAGQNDVYIIRTNENGDTIWTKTIGDRNNDHGYSVRQTRDGGFIIAGATSTFGGSYHDVFLIRLDKDTTGIQQNNPNNFINPNDLFVSYNNGNISIRYTIPYSSSVKLEAYDIKGKLVEVITDKFMQKGSYRVNWDSERFVAGIYFIKLSINGSSISKKFIIIK